MLRHFGSVLIGLLVFVSLTKETTAQISFPFNTEYKFLRGSDAINLPGYWNQPEYDYSAWETKPSPFWYGDGSGGTNLNDMPGSYSSIYLISEFTAVNLDLLKEIKFLVDYDDGFVIWINGATALKQNVPETVSNSSLALGNHESGTPVSITVDAATVSLIEGVNTLAIQVLNATLSSSDLHFNLSIIAQPQLPEPDPSIGSVGFDVASGFYNAPFNLTLSSPDPTAKIIYTLDGSNPKTSSTSFTSGSTTIIEINPESNVGRPLTPGVIVRASIQKEGFAPSISRTRSYIFSDPLKTQSYPGAPWPANDVNGQRIDLGMDSEVVNDSRYSSQIDAAFLDIPSMSLVTDIGNLFDPSYGIYVNAESPGEEWERDCSLELIDPDGVGFQVNAGVRIRGGASRGGWNPKHAFRLFFREEYGDAKLVYPLFGDEGTDTYDKIDLRTEQNYSWSKDGPPASDYNTFVRDIYSRQMQGVMGQPYSRSSYCHLFLNGIYWGLFMTEERPEARFAESYLGGNQDDYDVVKVTTHAWPYYNIATDGNMDAWNEIWLMSKNGFVSNADYFKLEGKDAEGNHIRGSNVLVDIDNLIDYMAMIFYTGSFDGPASAWYGEDMPNNYYAIYNREYKGTGFVFIGHDQEQSMMVDPLYVGDGLYENRVTIPDMSVAGVKQFHPQWLHHKLTSNAEYRLRFADRTSKMFINDGLFTPQTAEKLFNEFAAKIEKAIICESARWGDANTYPAKTKDDSWIPAIEDLNNRFFPYRTDIVVDQLKTAKLYTALKAPVIANGTEVISDELKYFSGLASFQLKNLNSSGEICYTLNGEDPRITGGEKSTAAISSQYSFSFDVSETTVVNARIKNGSEWSSLSKIVFAKSTEDYSNLRITEIHYHPDELINGSDTVSGQDMEFIELKNTGTSSINISGIMIDSAITYQIPERTVLTPGDFYVVASKPRVFYDIYGLNPSGNFKKNLSNSGEYILLTDPLGTEILSLTYSDNAPWPSLADGTGHSMVAVNNNPTSNPDESDYWRNSYYKGGSPFADDVLYPTAVGNSDAKQVKVYPNPASDYIVVQTGSDQLTDISIYDCYGKLVYEGIFSSSEIIIQTTEIGEKGMYYLRLKSSEYVETLKITIL